jgi:hypothetical protein
MSARRGRRPLDELDWMDLEGRYLFARYDVGRRMDPPRAPTVEAIADYMGVSARTVVTIRSRLRAWQRETA